MRTPFAVLGIVLLVVTAGVASAHGWAVTVDDQVVGDGTVLVGEVSMLDDGYVAVHVEDGDEPGRAVGHARLDQGEFTGVEVDLDEEYWNELDGTAHLMVAAHEDDGDGEFTWPDGDPLYRPDDALVADHFDVRKTDGENARVLAARQESDGSVTLERVDLPQDGFVVLYADDDGERGQVVGVKQLSAGRHENVPVEVDPFFYNEQNSRLYLVAGVHVDDGDGVWNAESDSPVAVDGAPVTTSFDARKTQGSVATPEPTPTSTPSPTASPPPTPTSTPTPTATATGSPTPSPTATTTAAITASRSPTSEPPAQEVPGFGPIVAVVALGVLAATVARWAR